MGIVKPKETKRPSFGVLTRDQAIERSRGISPDGVKIGVVLAVIGETDDERFVFLANGEAEVLAPHDQHPGGVNAKVARIFGKIALQ